MTFWFASKSRIAVMRLPISAIEEVLPLSRKPCRIVAEVEAVGWTAGSVVMNIPVPVAVNAPGLPNSRTLIRPLSSLP